MPIPPSAVGQRLPDLTVDVERGRLRMFAHAIGETDAVYLDIDAARAAGHRDIPVPPTFFFSLELSRPEPFSWLVDLGVDLNRMLHGEQSFTYRALAYAGDTLTVQSRITDVYTRKDGALEFVVRQIDVHREDQDIASLEQVLVIRHAETQ